MNKVLISRESLEGFRRKLGGPLVQFSINMPGLQKQSTLSYVLWKEGNHQFIKKATDLGFPILKQSIYHGAMGYVNFFRTDANPVSLKEACLSLEQTVYIGSYWDYDVFDSHLCKVRREIVGAESRTCFICDQPAKLCTFLRNHDSSKLLTKMRKNLDRYLAGDDSSYRSALCGDH